jgi:RND family efflux transporter MFP subunit
MTRPRWLSTALAWLGSLVAVLLLILWLAGAFEDKIEAGKARRVRTTVGPDARLATVTLTVEPVIEEAAGTVQAQRRTLVSARLLATIATVRVRAGEAVSAGDVLIELDARELTARVEEARGAVRAAEAEQARRAADLARAQALIRRGAISQSEFDQAQAAASIAAATATRGREALSAAEIGLSYTRITAPVSGRVVDRYAEPGDTAVPGQPLLALYDPSALRIEVPVRESLLPLFHIGDALDVRIGDRMLAGIVDEVVPQAEAGSRTFMVKIGLPREAGVYTGMFGRALIRTGERERLLIPGGTIERVGQLDFVNVVGDDGTLARRLVTLGAATGDQVEVLSGLRAGERVLLPPA